MSTADREAQRQQEERERQEQMRQQQEQASLPRDQQVGDNESTTSPVIINR